MKINIILIVLINYVYNTIDKCEACSNQTQCNDIDLEYDDFFCFKVKYFDINNLKCSYYPKEEKYQKLYWKLSNGLLKEFFSSLGKKVRKDIFVIKMIENYLSKAKKNDYKINEIVETEKGQLTKKDINTIASENTCIYHLYSNYDSNEGYKNIQDKKICYNVTKFDDIKNMVDCGFAVMKFIINSNAYKIKTCYLLPTEKIPKNFSFIYMNFIKSDIEKKDGIINEIFNGIAVQNEKNTCEEYYQDDKDNLSRIIYNIEVEGKDGRKIRYSSDNNNFEIISAGGNLS